MLDANVRKLDTLSGSSIYIKQKKVLLAAYTVLIVYLMLFGFGRVNRYEFPMISLKFTSFPMWFPRSWTPYIFSQWIFSLGNILAFAPFGILIPDCYPHVLGRYRKSLAFFIFGIVAVEWVQYVTRLGIFDVEDIVANAIGYSIGYWSWRMSYPVEGKLKKANLCVVYIALFTAYSIALAEILNAMLFIDPVVNLLPNQQNKIRRVLTSANSSAG